MQAGSVLSWLTRPQSVDSRSASARIWNKTPFLLSSRFLRRYYTIFHFVLNSDWLHLGEQQAPRDETSSCTSRERNTKKKVSADPRFFILFVFVSIVRALCTTYYYIDHHSQTSSAPSHQMRQLTKRILPINYAEQYSHLLFSFYCAVFEIRLQWCSGFIYFF